MLSRTFLHHFCFPPSSRITYLLALCCSHRNRQHAKRSRERKKIITESLEQTFRLLKEENEKLRHAIRSHLGENEANELLKEKVAVLTRKEGSLTSKSTQEALSLIKSFQKQVAQQQPDKKDDIGVEPLHAVG